MQTLDYVVLIGYFTVMIVIGVICSLKVKKQEDFFMGGRSFGKLFQTFAAFGAGTGSQDPIQVSRTTWTSGLSGIWSVLMWLFITPFYWIFGVWYRRMRHLTLGDWFVERYESRLMGAVYTLFAFFFQIAYLSTMFSAISKVAAPLIGFDTVSLPGFGAPVGVQFVLVPIIALIVVVYGIAGGLSAAYWTDVLQGLCIILLSLILIPFGLDALVETYGDPDVTASTMDGFSILHERVSDDYFKLFSGPRSGEFPIHYIVSLSLLGLLGIVVQPHFIATGGGSAKTENSARIGLVTGNFLKRFCTIGWALTALILLALMADNAEAARDPDHVWGIASREILGPMNMGLVGLMLACLLAALMSSADCYMVIFSSLAVRNIYAAYFNQDADEKTYIKIGRIAGPSVILGAVIVSLCFYNVFAQYKMALEVIIVCAAPFWLGMFWRGATRTAAWLTMAFSLAVFFVIPFLAPVVMPDLASNPRFAIATKQVETITKRAATPSDFAKRESWTSAYLEAIEMDDDSQMKAALAKIGLPRPITADASLGQDAWEAGYTQAMKAANAQDTREALTALGPPPKLVAEGASGENAQILEVFVTGGQSIFWTGGISHPADADLEEVGRDSDGNTTTITRQYTDAGTGKGQFRLDFLLYEAMNIDLANQSKAMLETLRLPPRLIAPFVVMILLSWITKKGSKDSLDRFFVKMKTPVLADHDEDALELEKSYQDPARFDHKKMFPGTNIEIQKPSAADVVGFLICVAICFAFLGIAVWLANLGNG